MAVLPATTTSATSLLSLLGSFWTELYQDDGQLLSVLNGVSQLQWQQALLVDETVRCTCRRTLPVYRRQQWYRLVLRDGEQVQRGDPFRYGDPINYGNTAGRVHFYGDYQHQHTSYALPEVIHSAAAVTNRIQDTTAWLGHGSDFILDPRNQTILFRSDPLLDSRFDKELVTRDGQSVQQTVVWLYQAELDVQMLQDQLGYALQIWAESSERYRDLLNAVADSLVGGTTRTTLLRLLTAVTQAAYTQQPETVEQILREPSRLSVVTDRAVYSTTAAVTPLVAVGDVLPASMPLFDTAELIPFRRGETPIWLPSLTLGKNLLGPSLPGPLTFTNEDVPLELLEVDGQQVVRFQIYGSATAVAAFWAAVDAYGESSGTTLGQRLDTRGPGYSPLYAGFLPATINPLKFVVENCLRENVWLLRLRQTTGADWLPVAWSPLLRRLLPPHTTVLLYIELAELTDEGLLGEDDTIDWMLDAVEILEDTTYSGVDDLLRPITLPGQ